MKSNIKSIIKSQHLHGNVKLTINGKTANIDTSTGLELEGNEVLLAECLRVLKKENVNSINKVNASNYVRTELKACGLYKKGEK